MRKRLEIISLLVFFLPLIVWFFSAIPGGLANTEVVRYWNNDDANILSYYGSLYKNIILMPVYHIGYPFFFFYVSAFTVIPMALILGPSPAAIAMGWRLANILFFLGSNVMIYVISRRYLRLAWVALFASAVYSTTYVLLSLMFQLRPGSCENFLSLVVMFLCFKMIESFRVKYLVWAAVVAGCELSTKYHAAFLLPVVYGVVFLVCSRGEINMDRLRKSAFWGLGVGGSLVFLAGVLWGVLRHMSQNPGIYIERFHGSSLAHHILDGYVIFHLAGFARLSFLGATFLLMVEGLSFAFLRNTGSTATALSRGVFWLAETNRLYLLFLAIFGVTFLLTNPYFFVYPYQAAEILVRFYKINFDNTGWDASGHGSAWNWFRLMWNSRVLGSVGTGFFAVYLLFEAAVGWRKTPYKETFWIRMVPLAHITVYFGYLFFRVGHQVHHYLGPIVADMAILSGVAMIALVNQQRSRWLKNCFAIGIVVLLLANLAEKEEPLRGLYNFTTQKDKDQGVLLVEWVNANFPHRPTVLCDATPLAYMMNVEVIAGAYRYDLARLQKVLDMGYKPQLIILTNDKNMPLAYQLRHLYKAVRMERYTGYSEEQMSLICILKRNDFKA